MDLQDLQKKGYFLKDTGTEHFSLARLSLMNSLKLFFKTSDDIYSNASRIIGGYADMKKECGLNYAMDACDSLIHLQHFIELYIKEVLKKLDELLIYDLKNKPFLYYQTLQNRANISDNDLENVHYIEFSEAKNILNELINKGVIPQQYIYIKKHIKTIETINQLRNRIAHRGMFILDYDALDELYGKYVFPFIQELAKNDCEYRDIFQYCVTLNNNDIKPFEDIIKEYQATSINKRKVYVLKMIGYAAYNNRIPLDLPPDPPSVINYNSNAYYNQYLQERRDKAAKIVKAYCEDYQYPTKCPVCNCITLIETSESDEDACGNYTCEIECTQCGFKLRGQDFLSKDFNGMGDLINY